MRAINLPALDVIFGNDKTKKDILTKLIQEKGHTDFGKMLREQLSDDQRDALNALLDLSIGQGREKEKAYDALSGFGKCNMCKDLKSVEFRPEFKKQLCDECYNTLVKQVASNKYINGLNSIVKDTIINANKLPGNR